MKHKCIKTAVLITGVIAITTLTSGDDMKFEPANIVFRFPEDDEV